MNRILVSWCYIYKRHISLGGSSPGINGGSNERMRKAGALSRRNGLVSPGEWIERAIAT